MGEGGGYFFDSRFMVQTVRPRHFGLIHQYANFLSSIDLHHYFSALTPPHPQRGATLGKMVMQTLLRRAIQESGASLSTTDPPPKTMVKSSKLSIGIIIFTPDPSPSPKKGVPIEKWVYFSPYPHLRGREGVRGVSNPHVHSLIFRALQNCIISFSM